MTGKLSQKNLLLVFLVLGIVVGMLQQGHFIPLGNNEMVLLYGIVAVIIFATLNLLKAIQSGKFTKEAYGHKQIDFSIFEEGTDSLQVKFEPIVENTFISQKNRSQDHE